MSETGFMSKKKGKNKEKLTVRDYITLGMMMILVYVVYTIIGMPLATTIIGIIFMHAACSLLWGTIFMLMYVRVNKKWVPLIFGILIGIMQIFNLWITAVAIVIGGIVVEIIWQRWNKKSFKTMTVCFSIQIISWYLGIFIPLIVIGDIESIIAENYLELFIRVKELVTGPLFFIGLFSVIVCTIIGAFIGKGLLPSHPNKC